VKQKTLNGKITVIKTLYMATHTTSVTIDAPAIKVFEALTQPELVKQWQFGKTVQSGWQTGDAIKFIAETGHLVLYQLR